MSRAVLVAEPPMKKGKGKKEKRAISSPTMKCKFISIDHVTVATQTATQKTGKFQYTFVFLQVSTPINLVHLQQLLMI